MSGAVRIGAFVALLGVVFALAFALGRALDPAAPGGSAAAVVSEEGPDARGH